MSDKARVFTHSLQLSTQLQGQVECLGNDQQPISESDWLLAEEPEGVTLRGLLEGQQFTLRFDLLSGQMNYRRQFGGGRKEPLAKAIGLKHNAKPKVLDATAGMGRESFLLASLGCTVTAVERNPVIFALLSDAVKRALTAPKLPFTAEQLQVIHHDSIEFISSLTGDAFEVIYLDPMFPARDKSAAVKKEMRIFKRLAGSDNDDAELLKAAIETGCKRVVVKRPNYAPFIGATKPSFQIESKKHRFDVYV